MPEHRTIVSVILAAGKGTRMRDNNALHKVCYTVQGVPVIHTSLEMYERCGLSWHLLVVGNNVEQVMKTVAESPSASRASYCFQAEQKGTAHATRVAANLLQAQGFDGDILVVAGDKVLEEGIVRRLLDDFYTNDNDLSFVVGNVEDFPDAGRIITGEQRAIIGNVEIFDCDRVRLCLKLRELTKKGPVAAGEVEQMALGYFRTEKKAAKALGSIWELLKEGKPIDGGVLDAHTTAQDYVLNINCRQYPPALMDNVRYTNLSVYLFKAQALYRSLKGVGSANAQNEEYLPDVIGSLIAEGARVSAVPLQYPEEAMAFNTPEELEEIERYYAGKTLVGSR
jgi:bifunctional N-acetylglucosamine-1-phosphate-uridyltransferase/glucosamine-1-phosphate-acetyltransferase GlmU-like protein